MATISSLLRSAESARRKQRNYEDSLASFQWQNSAKTADDWILYQEFLQTRQSETSEPSESLSYARTLKSAEDTYVSAEIERESIKILEGTGSKQQKLEKVAALYERAVERGNFDLAQNLYKQGLTLQEQILNEQERAQRVAGSMAKNQSKDLKSLIAKMEKGTGVIEVGDGEAYKSLYTIGEELKANGDTEAGLFTDAWLTTNAIRELVEDAYETATTQEAVDYIEDNLRPILDGTKKFTIAGQSMTASDIDLAYRSALANNPVYSVATSVNAEGINVFEIQKNQVEDFAWVRNDDGTYEAMEVQTRQTDENLSTKYSDEGKRLFGDEDEEGNKGTSVEDRLAVLGFKTEYGEDGKIQITDRNGRIYTDAVIEGRTVKFRGDPNDYSGGLAGMYEINLFQKDNFGELGTLRAGTVRPVAPDETSDFGTTSEFGGSISSQSDAGRAAVLSMSGVSSYSRPRFNMDQVVEALKVKDFTQPRISSIDNSGYTYGVAGTSSLLQSAGTTRNILDERNRKEEQARLNAQVQSQALSLPNVPSLNQTPVRQVASNGAPVRQLKVNTVAPKQRITSVGYVKPTRKITGVSTAPQYTGRLQVR